MTTRTSTNADTRLATVDAGDWRLPAAGGDLDELAHAAGLAARTVPLDVDDALLRFASASNHAGALLIRNVPIGDVPSTPPAPDAPSDKGLATEFALLTVARRLGQPVGYVPEHGGRIVQNLVPVSSDADLQTSTSSRSDLMFHTETAFHPHRPRHLLLLCLRGDPSAHTTLASVRDVIERLDERELALAFEPRFRTAVDASFLAGRTTELSAPRPLITGTLHEPTFVFDADLTIGIDTDAEDLLDRIRSLIHDVETSVVLRAGDLLVVDNNVAVHGRSPFSARFDGTDRWLQRAFVVTDLAPSAAERTGRVITTEFGHR